MNRETEKVKNMNDYIKLATKDKQEFINKLGKLEDLEEELGCPLEVVFKALKEGIWVEEYNSFEKHNVRGIGLKGLEVIDNLCSYGECDFTCYYKDYKKTWWLKEDRSE